MGSPSSLVCVFPVSLHCLAPLQVLSSPGYLQLTLSRSAAGVVFSGVPAAHAGGCKAGPEADAEGHAEGHGCGPGYIARHTYGCLSHRNVESISLARMHRLGKAFIMYTFDVVLHQNVLP